MACIRIIIQFITIIAFSFRVLTVSEKYYPFETFDSPFIHFRISQTSSTWEVVGWSRFVASSKRWTYVVTWSYVDSAFWFRWLTDISNGCPRCHRNHCDAFIKLGKSEERFSLEYEMFPLTWHSIQIQRVRHSGDTSDCQQNKSELLPDRRSDRQKGLARRQTRPLSSFPSAIGTCKLGNLHLYSHKDVFINQKVAFEVIIVFSKGIQKSFCHFHPSDNTDELNDCDEWSDEQLYRFKVFILKNF